jgi:hypothetical protein
VGHYQECPRQRVAVTRSVRADACTAQIWAACASRRTTILLCVGPCLSLGRQPCHTMRRATRLGAGTFSNGADGNGHYASVYVEPLEMPLLSILKKKGFRKSIYELTWYG